MIPIRTIFCFCILLMAFISRLSAQRQLEENKINPGILNTTWDAVWITHPDAGGNCYGVYVFKYEFDLEISPASFIIHVSADNRYELYVNGKRVSLGPAWGDLSHWRFESLDIAPWLKPGENRILARVVNFGAFKPVSQCSYKTAFIMQGNSEKESIINTDTDTWQVLQDKAYRPIRIDWRTFPYYYAGTPCDSFIVRHAYHFKQEADIPEVIWKQPVCEGYCHRGTPRQAGHYFADQSPRLLIVIHGVHISIISF